MFARSILSACSEFVGKKQTIKEQGVAVLEVVGGESEKLMEGSRIKIQQLEEVAWK